MPRWSADLRGVSQHLSLRVGKWERTCAPCASSTSMRMHGPPPAGLARPSAECPAGSVHDPAARRAPTHHKQRRPHGRAKAVVDLAKQREEEVSAPWWGEVAIRAAVAGAMPHATARRCLSLGSVPGRMHAWRVQGGGRTHRCHDAGDPHGAHLHMRGAAGCWCEITGRRRHREPQAQRASRPPAGLLHSSAPNAAALSTCRLADRQACSSAEPATRTSTPVEMPSDAPRATRYRPQGSPTWLKAVAKDAAASSWL